jgi:uncharacterized membrane-anchored protein YhcB (DUF1043 family)
VELFETKLVATAGVDFSPIARDPGSGTPLILYIFRSPVLHFDNDASRTSDGHLRWKDSKREETLSSLITKASKRFNDLFRRNAGRGLINVFLKMVYAIRPRISSCTVKQVVFFSKKCYRLYKHNGIKGLTQYLKACQVLLQQSIGGYKVKDLSPLNCRPKRNRYGSPLLIPRISRPLIHTKTNKSIVMLWMTLFGVYRVLDFKGKLKLNTITAPFDLKPSILKEWEDFIDKEWQSRLLFKKMSVEDKIPSVRLRPISTSSPTSSLLKTVLPKAYKTIVSTHWASLWLSAYLWLQDRVSLENLERFSVLLGAKFYVERIKLMASGDPVFRKHIPPRDFTSIATYDFSQTLENRLISDDSGKTWSLVDTTELERDERFLKKSVPSKEVDFDRNIITAPARGMLAKLSLKFEAAGKIRVFAMVDSWTQWIMEPLHKIIFRLLNKFETDGTFNQTAPILRLIHNFGSPKGFVPKTTFYSLDLSAATDRLPIALQVPIVSLIFDLFWVRKSPLKNKISDTAKEFGKLWRYLLVERFYYLHLSKKDWNKIEGAKQVDYKLKYSVGQPMGALSSWAMLAMTHHAIVAFVAKRAGYSDFQDYAVLGDDIIIANSKVALAYLHFLKEIGVEVGLAKSMISKRRLVLDFAKKFFVESEQMNAIAFKDCITTWTSTSLVKEFATKWRMSLPQILGFLDYGYKAKHSIMTSIIWNISTRPRVLFVWILLPGSGWGKETFLQWIGLNTASGSYREVRSPKSLMAIAKVVDEIIKEKIDLYYNTWFKWKKSQDELNSQSSAYIPINRNRVVEEHDFYSLIPTPVPMENILNTPLDKSVEYYFEDKWDDLYQSHRSFNPLTYDKIKTTPMYDLEQVLFKISYDFAQWYKDLSEINNLDEYKRFIEIGCNFIFISSSDIEERLLDNPWPVKRSLEKVFDDFNRIYSYWVRLSAVLWKGYVAKVKVSPKKPESKEKTDTEVPKENTNLDPTTNNSLGKSPQPEREVGFPDKIDDHLSKSPQPEREVGLADDKSQSQPLLRKDPDNFEDIKFNNKPSEPNQQPKFFMMKNLKVWVSGLWAFLSWIMIIFALSLLVSLSKNIYSGLLPFWKEQVRYVAVDIQDTTSDWIIWILLIIIGLLIGVALYNYMVPRVTTIDNTVEVETLTEKIGALEKANHEQVSHLSETINRLSENEKTFSQLLQQKSLEAMDLSSSNLELNSKISYLQSRLDSFSETIDKIRLENLSLSNLSSVAEKNLSDVNQLLIDAQEEMQRFAKMFNDLAQVVHDTSHVSSALEKADYFRNFECPAMDMLESLAKVTNPSEQFEIWSHYFDRTNDFSEAYVADMIKTFEILKDFFESVQHLQALVV